MNKILATVLIFLSTFSFSQKTEGGYLGKKNEISFDFSKPLRFGEYSFTYKRTYRWATAFIFELGFLNSKKEYSDLQVVNQSSINLEPLGTSSNYSLLEFPGVTNTSRGMKWTIGIIYSPFRKGMPLPLGYYSGYCFSRYRFTYTQDVNMLVENNYDQNSERNAYEEYKMKVSKFSYILGKSSYLKNDFVLDLSSRIRLYVGKVGFFG